MEEKAVRVLAIDDEQYMRDLLLDGLSRRGYEVSVAKDGREGLEEMERALIEVVITDLVMPECEGIETITAIRTRFPGTKIIAISGATFGADYLQMAKGLGADGVLAKPFTIAEVVALIERVLGGEVSDEL